MEGNRYAYVSFSKPQIAPELYRLIEAARRWTPINGRKLDRFDFAAWRKRSRDSFDFGPSHGLIRLMWSLLLLLSSISCF